MTAVDPIQRDLNLQRSLLTMIGQRRGQFALSVADITGLPAALNDLAAAIAVLTSGDHGDITVTGPDGEIWTIDAGAVTLAKLAGEVTARLVPALPNNAALFLNGTGNFSAPAGGGLSDGDKGDVIVSGGGTIITLDNGVVTLAKMDAAAISSFAAAVHGHGAATTSLPGFMAAADKVALDGLAAAGSEAFLRPVSGDLVLTTNGSGATTGTLIGAVGRMELFPWLARETITIQSFVVNVTTAVASALGKIVIYAADSNGRPAAKLHETGTIDLGTTGNKTIAASLTFTKGVTYWIGFRHSSTATLSTWAPNATPDINGGTTAGTAKRSKLQRTLAFATAAPDPWGFLSSEITSAAPTAVWLKMA